MLPEASSTPAPLPLAGVRVLDFSNLLPGPLASLLLADAGAEVLKVERPGTGDELRGYEPALDPSRVLDSRPVTRRWWEFRPNTAWAIGLVLLFAGVLYQFDKLSEFIYFQF